MAAAALFAETRGLAPRSRPERAVRARSGFIKIIIVVFASIAGVIEAWARRTFGDSVRSSLRPLGDAFRALRLVRRVRARGARRNRDGVTQELLRAHFERAWSTTRARRGVAN